MLTEEAEGYVAAGSPEAQAFNAVPAEGGITLTALKVCDQAQPYLVGLSTVEVKLMGGQVGISWVWAAFRESK